MEGVCFIPWRCSIYFPAGQREVNRFDLPSVTADEANDSEIKSFLSSWHRPLDGQIFRKDEEEQQHLGSSY